MAKNADCSPIRLQKAEHQLKQSGLASSIRANDGKKIPWMNREVDVLQDWISIEGKP
jgi:hypothetical protein